MYFKNKTGVSPISKITEGNRTSILWLTKGYYWKNLKKLDIIILPAVILLIIGCFGILNSRSLINSLFSLDVIDTATISIFVLIAATSGSQTPILSSAPRYANYSDPYPQAIILTAIVIGFATQALLCTIALRLSRSTPLLKYEDLEKWLIRLYSLLL